MCGKGWRGCHEDGTTTFGSTTLTVKNYADMFVWKINKFGNHAWAVQSQSEDEAGGYDIATDKKGNSYVCGWFWDAPATFGTTTLSSMGKDDVFVAKLDYTGAFKWARAGYGAGSNICFGVALGPKNRVHVSGEFEQHLTVGALTLTSPTVSKLGEDEDMFVWTMPTTK